MNDRGAPLVIGDRVRLKSTPETERVRVAGRIGTVVGFISLLEGRAHATDNWISGSDVEVQFDSADVPMLLGIELLERVQPGHAA